MPKLYCLLFFLPFLSLLQAQEEKVTVAQKFKAGIIAGITTSQVDGDGYGGFNKPGPIAGAYVGSILTIKIDWRFEIQYIQKGSRKNPNPEKGDYESYLLKLNYIDVPLLLRYRQKKVYFELGGSIGKLFNFTEQNQFGDVPQLYPFEKYDMMLLAGIYYQLSPKWLVSIRRSYSIKPIKKFPFAVYSPNLMSNYFRKGYYNSLLNLTFNYQFN